MIRRDTKHSKPVIILMHCCVFFLPRVTVLVYVADVANWWGHAVFPAFPAISLMSCMRAHFPDICRTEATAEFLAHV